MPTPEHYVLIHFVEAQAIGFQFARHRNDWPLHITLASWFAVNDVDALTQKLQAQAAQIQLFTVQVGERELFGPHQNVPVNVIVNQAPVRNLREHLVTAVREAGGEFDSKRWFENYRAHITQHDDATSRAGDTVVVDDFHMVRLLPENRCEVAAQFRLGQNS